MRTITDKLYKELIRYGEILDDTFIDNLNVRITIIKDDVTGRMFKIIKKDGEVLQLKALKHYSSIYI